MIGWRGWVGVCATASLGGVTIEPLDHPVFVGEPIEWNAVGVSGEHPPCRWDLGDGTTGEGSSVRHTYTAPGIYRIVLGVGEERAETASIIVRVHTEETIHRPPILLDTDARNEVDDQHYIAYAVFSELDVLGVNSIHHGGGQEPINYGEILWILHLAERSGLPRESRPFVFHGADRRLEVPESGRWEDTEPVVSEASEAILAAARGASPGNPVWVLPVGPCTNVASAVLQARREGLDLRGRIRVVWLGGGPEYAHRETFNGSNDPWAVYVMGQSGVDFWVLLENPTGASLRMDVRVESEAALYPDNPLGEYLKMIVPRHDKALYDVTTVATVISEHEGFGWLTSVEPATVLGPAEDYAWAPASASSPVRIIREIDAEAMKRDFFATLNGSPTGLSPREH